MSPLFFGLWVNNVVKDVTASHDRLMRSLRDNPNSPDNSASIDHFRIGAQSCWDQIGNVFIPQGYRIKDFPTQKDRLSHEEAVQSLKAAVEALYKDMKDRACKPPYPCNEVSIHIIAQPEYAAVIRKFAGDTVVPPFGRMKDWFDPVAEGDMFKSKPWYVAELKFSCQGPGDGCC